MPSARRLHGGLSRQRASSRSPGIQPGKFRQVERFGLIEPVVDEAAGSGQVERYPVLAALTVDVPGRPDLAGAQAEPPGVPVSRAYVGDRLFAFRFRDLHHVLRQVGYLPGLDHGAQHGGPGGVTIGVGDRGAHHGSSR